jgi:type I restriction enzyme, S subunit
MLTPKWKQYPVYKKSNTWISEFPEHWKLKKIKHLFKIHSGATPKSDNPDFWGGAINWVTPDDLGSLEGIILGETSRKITLEGYESCGVSISKKGSIAISTRAPIGHLAITSSEMSCNQGCRLIEPVNSTEIEYFHALLEASLKELQSWGQGSTFKELPKHRLQNLPVLLPPPKEIKAIVNFLNLNRENISESIKTLNLKLLKLEEKRLALVTKAVTKGLKENVPMMSTGLDWYPEIPAHWKLSRVKHIARTSPSNVDKKKYEGQAEVKLANYVDVYYNDKITEELDFMIATASENEIAKFTLIGGDLIITKDSEAWDDIAVPAFVPETLEGVVCGYHLTLIRPNQEHVLGEFLFRTYQALGVRDQYHYNANGVTRYGLGSYWVNNGVVPVPPLDEQREIAEYIDSSLQIMDALEANIKSEIEKLKEYRISMISAAATGKIDVRGHING